MLLKLVVFLTNLKFFSSVRNFFLTMKCAVTSSCLNFYNLLKLPAKSILDSMYALKTRMNHSVRLTSIRYYLRAAIGTLSAYWSTLITNGLLLPFRKAAPHASVSVRNINLKKQETQPSFNTSKVTLPALWARLTLFLWNQGLYFVDLLKRTWGEGFVYFKGVIIVLVADALIVDDEPLWEPVEWSMAQAWILIIFLLAWIAENLIVSRYGSYTGRDKRVWFAWYKTFWLIDLGFVLSLGAAIIFVMIPFYYELNYIMSFTTSWWNWYTRVFFFKFLAFNLIVLLGALFLQIKIRTLHWKSAFLLVLIVNLFFSYLLYTHFFLSFFSYFTHVNWYNSTRLIDYVQLSHEPNKWSWGAKKRDHFSYHKSSTVFWFKNDGPFAAASLLIQFLFFITLFLTFFYWLILLRRIYATQEFSFTYTIYAISALKQFFFFFFLLYLFVLGSYLVAYWRFPIEFIWVTNPSSWFTNFIDIIVNYPELIISIFN